MTREIRPVAGCLAIAATCAIVAAGCVFPGVVYPRTAPDDGSVPPNGSLIDAVVARLRVVAPAEEGRSWNLTTGNRLAPDWVLQTPDCWGSVDCAQATGIARMVDTIEHDVASATDLVDILTLNPLPTGAFRAALVRGLQRSIAGGSRPRLRLLAGLYPFGTSLAQPFGDFSLQTVQQYLHDLLVDVGAGADTLAVSVARANSDPLFGWNHSKVIAIDGRVVIEGGHNLWAGSYLQTTDPVHDLSMRIEGPAARDAHVFANRLWADACEGLGDGFRLEFAGNAPCGDELIPAPALPVPDGVRALSIAKLGVGIAPDVPLDGTVDLNEPASCVPLPDLTNLGGPAYDSANAGEEAARALIRRAEQHVFIAQQDLIGFCPVPRYDKRLFEAIAGRLLAGVGVTIVLSTPGAQGKSGTPYSNVGSLNETLAPLVAVVQSVSGDPARARAAVCGHLSLASLRFGPTSTSSWPNGHGLGLHAKMVEVDGKAFMIGSNNLYPAWLQEFGYLIEDPAAVAHLRDVYTSPMWVWSRATALVDAEQSRCPLP